MAVRDLQDWELREIFNDFPVLTQKRIMAVAHMEGRTIEQATYRRICASLGDSEGKIPQELLAAMEINGTDESVPRFSKVH